MRGSEGGPHENPRSLSSPKLELWRNAVVLEGNPRKNTRSLSSNKLELWLKTKKRGTGGDLVGFVGILRGRS